MPARHPGRDPVGARAAPSEAETGSADSTSVGRSVVFLEEGAALGARYRIERCIGEGGMGTVYQAHDGELDRTVALKLLQPDRTADPRALQRFKQELLLARSVSHRNILRIHDLGDVDGVKFISMDYVDGQDLYAILKQEGRLPPARAVAIARQLCEALQAAHDAGVLHRDLKPHNVLVGPRDHVYVSDFGLAKSLEGDEAGLTRTGDVPGTPRYMSPEQVEGGPLDHRSDLYTFGLILYEMLTGNRPFPGRSSTEQMLRRVQGHPTDPREFTPDLPEHLRRIVLRCLERDPAARYDGARDILADLDAQRASPPPGGSRSTTITVPVPGGRRAWALAGAILLALAAPLVSPSVRQRLAGWWGTGTRTGGAAAPERKRVAVLPFRVVGGREGLAHLGPGLAETLSAKLSALASLSVASNSAVERAVQKDSRDKIARDLGAAFLVTGSVQEGADRLRIVVSLEDVANPERAWSREFSLLPADLLAVEDQLHSWLVAKLEVDPGNEERARAEAGSTESLEAHELYLKGRNAMRGEADLKNLEAAIGFFEAARTKDPRFALAYAGLANASMRLYRNTREPRWSERALAAAEQGRRLAEDLLEVRLALAYVYQNTGKTTEAVAELKRAVALAPGSDEAYRRLGRAYLNAGRKDEALAALTTAVSINPYHWVNYNQLAFAHYSLGAYDRAIEANLKVIELEPDGFSGHNDLGAMYLLTGRYAEAAAAFRKALAVQPNPDTYTNLGLSYAYAGRFPEAVPMFEKAVELRPQKELYVGNLADAYRWVGDERAARMYDEAIKLTYKDLEVNPRSAEAKAHLALHHAKKGQHARARQFMDQALQVNPSDLTIMTSEAIVHGLAGRMPEGLAALEKALRAGLPVPYVEADPNLGPLRADPRYRELVKATSASR
jgi:eukaryotic-like serine/threonine-protein kinase